MIKGIGHVAFEVKDMSKSLHFYCDILGFEKAFDLKDTDGNPWIEYVKVGNGQFIELFYAKEDLQKDSTWQSYSHLCFEVEDIYEVAGSLENNGIPLDVEPVQGIDMNYQCWARDPDGNRIEFMQMSPQSPQLSL